MPLEKVNLADEFARITEEWRPRVVVELRLFEPAASRNMGNIEYLDSAGLNTFVDLLTVVKQTGGRIGVAAATQQVEVLFKLTRLELVFAIRRTVIDAIDAIEKVG